MSVLLIVIIVFALVFDFINGFHDAANSIATVVSTKVLTPLQAVMWAALFNFAAFFIFKDHGVANTVAKTVRPDAAPGVEMMYIVLAGLLAAIAWNLFTWWFGIPSSSSHTLIGGFAGAAIAHSGFSAIDLNQYPNIFHTVMFIFLAPLTGMLIAYIISLWFISSFNKTAGPKIFSILLLIGVWAFVYMMVHNRGIELYQSELAKSSVNLLHLPGKALLKQSAITSEKLLLESRSFKWLLMGSIVSVMAIATLFMSRLTNSTASKVLKRLQLVSSAAFSIGHGGNDAQKVMGIITVALIAGGQIKDFKAMPTWVPLACYSAIALGTLSGGWKIIKTMGTRITKVTPFEGVAAETAGAITLFITENLKIPVSTTHTITGSIIGVGATKRLSAVRWGVTINLLWAWILTIPVSGLMAAGIYWVIRLFV